MTDCAAQRAAYDTAVKYRNNLLQQIQTYDAQYKPALAAYAACMSKNPTIPGQPQPCINEAGAAQTIFGNIQAAESLLKQTPVPTPPTCTDWTPVVAPHHHHSHHSPSPKPTPDPKPRTDELPVIVVAGALFMALLYWGTTR
jgi:hypothetical protein